MEEEPEEEVTVLLIVQLLNNGKELIDSVKNQNHTYMPLSLETHLT